MRERVVVAGVLVALCGSLLAARPAAQCATSYLLTGSSQFGQAFDVSGDLLVVGDGSLGFGGTAIVMRRAEWGWEAVYSVFSSAPEANGRFGDAVAIGDEWLAVGAPGELGAAGAVHVFRKTCEAGLPCAWVFVERLQAPQPAANDRFGTALALDGARLLVSAPQSDVAAEDAGALFLFDLSGDTGGHWTHGQTLTAGAGASQGVGLGSCVALEGALAVAGSKYANVAWIFEAVAGTFGPALELSDPDAGGFGSSVATDGIRVIIGAPGSNITSIKSGAAHLFEEEEDGWEQMVLLKPPGPVTLFAVFGTSVAIDGPTAAVGSTGANGGKGAVHVFHHEASGAAGGGSGGGGEGVGGSSIADDWLLHATFDTLPGPASSGLGFATALDGDTLVCAAKATFGPPGVIYTFGGVAPWTEVGGGLAGTAGLPALLTDGSLCGGGTLSFTIVNGRPVAPALVVVGLEAAPQPWKGGVMWPAPQLVLPLMLDVAGNGTLLLHVPSGHPSQQAVYAQGWIADPAASAGLSATPAITAETP